MKHWYDICHAKTVIALSLAKDFSFRVLFFIRIRSLAGQRFLMLEKTSVKAVFSLYPMYEVIYKKIRLLCHMYRCKHYRLRISRCADAFDKSERSGQTKVQGVVILMIGFFSGKALQFSIIIEDRRDSGRNPVEPSGGEQRHSSVHNSHKAYGRYFSKRPTRWSVGFCVVA